MKRIAYLFVNLLAVACISGATTAIAQAPPQAAPGPAAQTPEPGSWEYRRYGYDRPAAAALKLAAARNAALEKSAPPARQPNIIFYIVDDQARHRINQLPEGRDEQGNPRNITPTLDRLATSGVILDQMHVPSAVCIPSRFSILTGTYGSRAQNAEMLERLELHGYPPTGQNAHILPGQTVTVADRLRDAGYRTGAVGKNHVVEVHGYNAGRFDDDINKPAIAQRLIDNHEKVRQAFLASGFDYADRLYHNNLHPNAPHAVLGHNLDWITEGALEFIEDAAQRDQPFFLYFGSTMPHGPVAPKYTYRSDRRLTPKGVLDEPVDLLIQPWEIKRALDQAGIDNPQVGNALWIDSSVQVIHEKLEELGLDDNTIFIYFNDHGVEAGKTSVFQGGMVTYNFVSGPEPWVKGGPGDGRRSDALLSSVDWAATMLSWAGADPARYADEFDGLSFAPVLSGRMQATRSSVYGEMGYSRSVRVGDWKYIALRPSPYLEGLTDADKKAILNRWFQRRDRQGQRREANEPTDPFPHIIDIPGGVDNTWGPMRKHPHYFDRDQLYNLADDPDEQVNLAVDPAYGPVLETMRLELSRYLERLPGKFGEFPGTYPGSQRPYTKLDVTPPNRRGLLD
ncbi:MAG: sulfatase-like hydrolase/transferase [Planctomycetota bacterium]